MGSLKPWQLVLVIVAFAVLGVSLWISLSGEKVKSASSFYMVDVMTGEVYKADISGRRSVMVPAKSPETRVRSIVPIVKTEDNTWIVEDKFRGLAEQIIADEQGSLAESINPQTWVVIEGIGNAVKYRYPE